MRKSGFFRGFAYAWSGFLAAVREERNLRFHLVAGAFVLYFSRFYDFTRGERLLLVAAVYFFSAWYRLPLLLAAAGAGYFFIFHYRKGAHSFDLFDRD